MASFYVTSASIASTLCLTSGQGSQLEDPYGIFKFYPKEKNSLYQNSYSEVRRCCIYHQSQETK